MKAGYARVDITPPLGTPMLGYGNTVSRPAMSAHDPLYARAVYVSHGKEQALIISMDLCFVGRDDSDRLKGVIGREMDLLPRQILINATHNHAGPAMGCYLDLEYNPVQRDYLRAQEAAVLRASLEARDTAREAHIRAGVTHSNIPVNRRKKVEGKVHNLPNPDGLVQDSLPLCLLEDTAGRPIALLFSIATHVVAMNKQDMSADWPGVACDAIDNHLGTHAAVFLQACGGDSRPRQLNLGDKWNWACTWTDAEAIGKTLAQEVIAGLKTVLHRHEPDVASAILDLHFPLQNNHTREEYAKIAGPLDNPKPNLRHKWAQRWLKNLDLGQMQTHVGTVLQGIQLGKGLRIAALEGEPLAPHGLAMERFFGAGVTFAIGYSNGEGLYLCTSQMLDEGGYEPESYWEYGHASALAKGIEKVRDQGLEELKRRGIN